MKQRLALRKLSQNSLKSFDWKVLIEKLWLKTFGFNTKWFSLSDAPTCQPQHQQMREVRCSVLIFFISFSQLCSVKFGLQLHRGVGRSKSPKVAQKPSKDWVLQALKVLDTRGWLTWELSFCSQGRQGGGCCWSPLRARWNPETCYCITLTLWWKYFHDSYLEE